jgi:hypothetical protein
MKKKPRREERIERAEAIFLVPSWKIKSTLA